VKIGRKMTDSKEFLIILFDYSPRREITPRPRAEILLPQIIFYSNNLPGTPVY
jgi:hypothetical protein